MYKRQEREREREREGEIHVTDLHTTNRNTHTHTQSTDPNKLDQSVVDMRPLGQEEAASGTQLVEEKQLLVLPTDNTVTVTKSIIVHT